MFKIIKKCEKSEDNPYGIIEINSLSELNKPFLMCLSSIEDDNNSVFGLIKEGARAARVRTTDELAGGFKIDEMPFDFLGIKNCEDGLFSSLTDVIYSIITKDKDVDSMIKNARNINFFVYCNATKIYVEMEKRIIERLKIDGISEEDIKKILTQISLVSIASNVKLSHVYATTVLFKDANDGEVYDYVSNISLKKMAINGRQVFIDYLKKENNSIAFAFNGTGEHLLKEYFKDNNIVKSSLCACVSYFVENSIKNNSSHEFEPISIKKVLPIVIKNNGEFREPIELLKELDDRLQYNVSRYTLEEDLKLKEMEEYYKSLVLDNIIRH